MTNAVIYARYSTDLQSDASIEDQIRTCQERAQKDGLAVGQCYSDHAISGASMLRPGIQMMMQDAAAGKFSTVYAEALDRISRDQEDIAAIYKRLTFSGVRLITLSEGEVSQLHIGLKGTMNALFLKDLADKTRRGLRGRVELGKSGGGKCFGYDVVPGDERGGRIINEQQAAIVERIASEYGKGKSPKAIAHQLNREGVPGPTGNAWGPSTIYGNRQRGTGIINNELYIGRLVWNRLQYIKDPDTGKRVSRLNPEDEWIIQDVPELRILDEGTWQKIKDRQKALDATGTKFRDKKRPRYLFSGLIKCGCCGGGFSVGSQTHLVCSTSRNKGTCDNRLTIKREQLEQDVLLALRAHLMDPDLSAIFCDEYTKHMNKLRMQHNASLTGYQKEFQKIEKKLSQMVDAIADGAPVAPIKDKMHELEDRRVELRELLKEVVEAPVLIHPKMALRYHEQIQELIGSLNSDEHRSESIEIIRTLVEKIVLTPDASGTRLVADLHGDLAGILAISADLEAIKKISRSDLQKHKALLSKGLVSADVDGEPDQVQMVGGGCNHLELRTQKSRPERAADVCDQKSQAKLVAGAGFEPATFRL